MSRELFKMNMIASVQKLDNEDIEIIQNYIETIEQENKQLKEELDYIKPKYDMAMDLVDKGVENSYKMVKDYKSRCEKAIEYIKSLQKSEVIKLNRKEETFKDISKQQVAKNELVLSMIKSNKLLEILGDKE